jgi:hypothetical protein
MFESIVDKYIQITKHNDKRKIPII